MALVHDHPLVTVCITWFNVTPWMWKELVVDWEKMSWYLNIRWHFSWFFLLVVGGKLHVAYHKHSISVRQGCRIQCELFICVSESWSIYREVIVDCSVRGNTYCFFSSVGNFKNLGLFLLFKTLHYHHTQSHFLCMPHETYKHTQSHSVLFLVFVHFIWRKIFVVTKASN